MIEITLFRKAGGPLTKRLFLTEGKFCSDGSACRLNVGTAYRQRFEGVDGFAAFIDGLPSSDAIALAALRPELPDKVWVVTKGQKKLGPAPEGSITRTPEFFVDPSGRLGLWLWDYDSKGMPSSVREAIEAGGGVWETGAALFPEIAGAPRVERPSTSTGCRNTETGEVYPGGLGMHEYVLIQDTSDRARAIAAAHKRACVRGFGWGMVGRGGQFLERSIVDRGVARGAGLVFEGQPEVEPPLEQDQAARRPRVYNAGAPAIDSRAVFPDLTPDEEKLYRRWYAAERARIKPEMHARRKVFVEETSKELRQRKQELTDAEATVIATRYAGGVLLPDVALDFDDEALAGHTVMDVLADPERYNGETMADPLEGREYGRCKAMVMVLDDGTVSINSFAHGGGRYRLQHDARSIEHVLRSKPPGREIVPLFARMAANADLDPAAEEALIGLVVELSGVGKRVVGKQLKFARANLAPEFQTVGSEDDGAELELLTEAAVAEAFIQAHGIDIRYDYDRGWWFVWDDVCWRADRGNLVRHLINCLAVRLAEPSKYAAQVKTVVGKAGFTAGVEHLVKVNPKVTANTQTWDSDPWLLGTPGGTVELKTGRLRPARREDYITQLTSVTPAERTDCPGWEDFLLQSCGFDVSYVQYLQRWNGYALTGMTSEEKFLYLFGSGGNGKGTFLRVTEGIMAEYAITAPAEVFTAGRSRHPTELARLRGKRLACVSEVGEGKAWDEARIKAMTGRDKIPARFMSQDFFEYFPLFKLFFIGNNQPELRTVDEAMRRRINLGPFIHKPKVVNKGLTEALLAQEGPQILRWMIDGCLDWQEHGLSRPAVVEASTEIYFSEQDIFAQWLSECCELGDDYAIEFRPLFVNWQAFNQTATGEIKGSKSFSFALRNRGLTPIKNTFGIRGRGFKGIRLAAKTSSYHDEGED